MSVTSTPACAQASASATPSHSGRASHTIARSLRPPSVDACRHELRSQFQVANPAAAATQAFRRPLPAGRLVHSTAALFLNMRRRPQLHPPAASLTAARMVDDRLVVRMVAPSRSSDATWRGSAAAAASSRRPSSAAACCTTPQTSAAGASKASALRAGQNGRAGLAGRDPAGRPNTGHSSGSHLGHSVIHGAEATF